METTALKGPDSNVVYYNAQGNENNEKLFCELVPRKELFQIL